MAEPWFFDNGGNLYFVYRAKRWDTTPARNMNFSELTAVTAQAFDASGAPLVVAQQPSYVASLEGYLGHLSAGDIVGVTFVSIKLTPTVAPAVPEAWAPMKIIDIVIELPSESQPALTLE